MLVKTGCPSNSFMKIGTSFLRNIEYNGPLQNWSMLSRSSVAIFSLTLRSIDCYQQAYHQRAVLVSLNGVTEIDHGPSLIPKLESPSLAAMASMFRSDMIILTAAQCASWRGVTNQHRQYGYRNQRSVWNRWSLISIGIHYVFFGYHGIIKILERSVLFGPE